VKIVRVPYEQAVGRWPNSKWAVEAQKRLARMYIHIGDYEKADAATGILDTGGVRMVQAEEEVAEP
jgi:hypothetical protein